MTTETKSYRLLKWLLPAGLALLSAGVYAHGIARSDQAFVQGSSGMQLIPFIYLGAKHMVTGYDHLLFLAGVIFFLYRIKDVAVYVTLFAIGHSTTLLLGVLGGIHADPYLIDAVIGLSVVYKAFDNIDGFQQVFGFRPEARTAVLFFGFFHGFGLSTKLQEFSISADGLVANMLAFNVGVEIGQLLALSIILLFFNFWRIHGNFLHHAYTANVLLMAAGFILMGYQLTGYFML